MSSGQGVHVRADASRRHMQGGDGLGRDAEQDILVMLLERWHYYDGARGSSIGAP
jgi:hypothetical protein